MVSPPTVGDRLDDFDRSRCSVRGVCPGLPRAAAVASAASSRSRCRPTAGTSHRRWPSSTTRTSCASTTSGSSAERKLRLLYMHYLAGGTLASILEYARQVPTREWTGETFVHAIDRCWTAAARPRRSRDCDSRSPSGPGGRWCAGSAPASPTPWSTPTAAGVLHRDVKPPTSCSAPTGRRAWPTSTSGIAPSSTARARWRSSAAASCTCRRSSLRPSTRPTSGRPRRWTDGPTSTRSPSPCGRC